MLCKRLWDMKVIHITKWERQQHGPHMPYYALGCLPDAERLKAYTGDEINARNRHKYKTQRTEVYKEINKRAYERKKRYFAENPDKKERNTQQRKEWAIKRFNRKPQALKSIAMLDEVAFQFGITWRFRSKKSASRMVKSLEGRAT